MKENTQNVKVELTNYGNFYFRLSIIHLVQ